MLVKKARKFELLRFLSIPPFISPLQSLKKIFDYLISAGDQGHGRPGVPSHWGVLDTGDKDEFGPPETEETIINWSDFK